MIDETTGLCCCDALPHGHAPGEADACDSAICPACDEPNGKHCKDCWRCPGDRHDPMCGF